MQHHFIIGIGRSGTSLLVNIFNRHQTVGVVQEFGFYLFFRNHFRFRKTIKKSDITLFEDYLNSRKILFPTEWSFFNKKLENKKDDWRNYIENDFITFSENINEYIINAEKPALSHLIEKNPVYTLFLDSIVRDHPEAKFILLVRDYRANIYSRRKNTNIRRSNIPLDAARWTFYTKKALKFAKRFPDKVHICCYEALTAQPEKELHKMCDFLGLPYEERLLDKSNMNQFEEIKNEISSNDVKKQYVETKYADLNKELYQASEEWKIGLSRKEIEIAEYIASKTGSKFGYLPINKIKFSFGNSYKKMKGTLSARWQILKLKIGYRLPVQLKLYYLRKKALRFQKRTN